MNSYFSHDSNARNSDKLIPVRTIHGAAGYGVYFMILERLREEPTYMSVKDYNMIAFDLRVDTSLVRSIIENFGLFAFTEDGKCFYSESFMKRMAKKDDIASKRKMSGEAGLKKRWNSGKMANATENDSNCHENSWQNAHFATENDSKESKVKKSKDIIPPTPLSGDSPPPPERADGKSSDTSTVGEIPSVMAPLPAPPNSAGGGVQADGGGNPPPSAEIPPKPAKKRGDGARVFTPPTAEEVRAYCTERKNGIDADRFVDHYAARGWRYSGNTPMKDWKAAVRTWEGNEKKFSNQPFNNQNHERNYGKRDEGRLMLSVPSNPDYGAKKT